MSSIDPNNLNETRLLEKEISNLDRLVKSPIFLLKNKNKPFFDTNSGAEVMNSISLINHNSIKDIENKISQKVEYQRFRGNFYIEGLAPWKERNLLGKIIKISGLPFRINENIPRCTATNLRPKTDKSTFNLPQKLKQFYGHSDLGVYILPLQDGEISAGDRIKF